MGRLIDRIHGQSLLFKENPLLLRDKYFIMGIMKPFQDELPSFVEFYEYHSGKKDSA